MQIESEQATIKIKWGKQSLNVDIGSDDKLEDLRAVIYSLTNVLPLNQKLMFKGKFLKNEQTPISDFKIKNVS